MYHGFVCTVFYEEAYVVNSVAAVIQQAINRSSSESARVDAEYILMHALEKPQVWLYAHADYVLSSEQYEAFFAAFERRLAGEPVAYIMGSRGFWTFDVRVTPDTLIPRPETELLVELCLTKMHPQRTVAVLDLGTGSGAIALAVASERKLANVVAVDYSEAALCVAKQNAETLNLTRIEFMHSDWYAQLSGKMFDVIVSNPPYIEQDDTHLLQGDVRYEPSTALVSGVDGLADIRKIIAGAKNHLRENGWLLIEHGWNQAEKVRAIFSEHGFLEIQTAQDLEHRDRVTMAKTKS